MDSEWEFLQTALSNDANGVGADTSGNNHHFAVSNFHTTDNVLDSPTNNFPVMSSIHPSSGNFTISEGNLKRIKKCLGRRYSLFIPEFDTNIIEQKGKWLSFSHTFEGLTSLPSGTYTLSLISEHSEVAGFAMLTHHDSMTPKRFTLDLFFQNATLTNGPLTLVFMDKAPPKSQAQLDKERHALPSSHFILQTSKNLTLEENE